MHICLWVCENERTTSWVHLFFFSIMWFPGIELWSSGLVANAFTHWVILLALNRNYWAKRNRWNEYIALEVKCWCPWWSGRGRERSELWGGDDQIRALRGRWQICRLQIASLTQVCNSVFQKQKAMQVRVLVQTAQVPQRPEKAVANEWPNQRGNGEHHQLLVLALSAWKALRRGRGGGRHSGAQCGGTREPRIWFCSEAQESTEQRLRKYLEFL